MSQSRLALQSPNLVAETLLIPLYCRALEARRCDALIQDDTAAALIRRIDYDFARIKCPASEQVNIILRVREFDRHARNFMAAHPAAVVVHIGCGLDTRFERVDDGKVEWYDLDLPEVIEFRSRLLGVAPRCHMIGSSVHESAWMETVSRHAGSAFLFLAEGVLPYFSEEEVRRLVLTLKDRFPGAEMVFDAMTPFLIWIHNLELARTKIGARLRWGLKHGRGPESWGDGIRMLEEWFYFDRPEPRLGAARFMRYFPPLAKGAGIFHYRLGKAAQRNAACLPSGS